MTYAEKLKDPRWQKKRTDILQRDNFTCQLCEDIKTTLAVHHKKYYKEPWDAKDEDLITYCEHCHAAVEYSKKQNNIIPIKVVKVKTVALGIRIALVYGSRDYNSRMVDIFYFLENKLNFIVTFSDSFIFDLTQTLFPKHINYSENG